MNKIDDIAAELKRIAKWHYKHSKETGSRWHLAVCDLLEDVADWIEEIHHMCPETNMPKMEE